ncbi:hypothetical protein [Serratia marcescens]|uniref:hypothetical protein n=1 Tax=Serratia marcescens TaxID=615 RepID=UPI00148DEC52|nr:hypothetical protein [Serratia marcescens]QJU42322.1 hypothetical protein HMI62_24760 [Serratia marcescens]
MSLLRKVTLLIGRFDNKINRQQRKLTQLRDDFLRIQRTIDSLDIELCGMKSLLKGMHPQGEKLSRAGLFSLRRKQSVIKRRMVNIVLESGQQQLALTNCEQELIQAQELFKFLQLKTKKYTAIQEKEKIKAAAVHARIEEVEIEERSMWKK